MHAYDSSTHLSFADISTDGRLPPDIIQVKIKASKTDPFRQGVSVYIGRSKGSLCPVSALLSYLAIRGDKQAFFSSFMMVPPSQKIDLYQSSVTSLDKQASTTRIMLVTAFVLAQQLQQRQKASKTP